MTDLSRGARVRRGGRRPGWVLLTTLLVLAIGASSALVFTSRVELLKLAVILALWAAVVAAFVSVIYRRQSDVDQARARDLKLVYDLQLDREISARREYELTVESQLRRELASELRAHSADEVSALRAELAALRTNLEILFDAELSERPALETERRTVRGYSEWDRENESARERINRVTSVRAEEPPPRADDSSIIDVPEEPLVPPPREPDPDEYQAAAYAYQPTGAHQASGATRAAEAQQDEATPPTGFAVPGQSATPSKANAGMPYEPAPTRRSHRRQESSPEPPQQQQRPEWPAPAEAPRHQEIPTGWQPVSPDGQWLPPRTPGSNWNSEPADNTGTGPWRYHNAPSRDSASVSSPSIGEPTSSSAPPVERRGRHSSADEVAGRTGPPAAEWRGPGYQARARHSADDPDFAIGGPAPAMPAMSPAPPPHPPSPQSPSSASDKEPAMSPPPPPAARHRGTDPLDADAPPSGGQSVAELLARLQTSPAGSGRRRRRAE
jgi:hypothetical protein